MATESDSGARLLLAAARLNRWATRNAEFDTPPAQARLLSLIFDMGPARISDLAQADHCSQPTMTTQVQRVEAAGWAVRTSDPNDARVALISLTPQGEAALAHVRQARVSTLAPVMASLTDQEREQVEQATAIIDRLLQRTEDHVPSAT